jgi:hypothetical protein
LGGPNPTYAILTSGRGRYTLSRMTGEEAERPIGIDPSMAVAMAVAHIRARPGASNHDLEADLGSVVYLHFRNHTPHDQVEYTGGGWYSKDAREEPELPVIDVAAFLVEIEELFWFDEINTTPPIRLIGAGDGRPWCGTQKTYPQLYALARAAEAQKAARAQKKP